MTVYEVAELLSMATENGVPPPYKMRIGPIALRRLRADIAKCGQFAQGCVQASDDLPDGYAGELFGMPVWEVASMCELAEVVTA